MCNEEIWDLFTIVGEELGKEGIYSDLQEPWEWVEDKVREKITLKTCFETSSNAERMIAGSKWRSYNERNLHYWKTTSEIPGVQFLETDTERH